MECPVKIPRTGIARDGSPGTLRRAAMRPSSTVLATLFLLVGVATAQVPSPRIEGPITGPGNPFVETTSFDLASVGKVFATTLLAQAVRQGRRAEFGTPGWTIAVHLADKEPTIVDLTLAYRRANPANDSSKLNVFQTQ